MKTACDPRHIRRRQIVKALFAETFTQQPRQSKIIKAILKQSPRIDTYLKKAAPTWPIDKLNRIDLSILRLAVYELKKSENPPKVVIDEAVELAKELGSENSASFVNGVLGTVYGKIRKSKKN